MYSSSPTPIVLVPKLRGPPTNPIQPVATHASDSKEPPYPIVIIRLPQVAGLLMVSAETIIALQAESSNSRRIVLPVITRVLRSEEHTSELQSQSNLVCRLLLEKKKNKIKKKKP